MRVVDYAVSSPVSADLPWTAADIDRAAGMWNDDKLTASGIAARMGRSRSSVCGMISRNRHRFAERNGGDGAGGWTVAMLDNARRLHALGVTPRGIAAEIGVTLSRLMRVIDRRTDLFPKPEPAALPDLDALAASEARELAARARRRERDLAMRRQLALTTTRAVDFEPGLADLAAGAGHGGDGPCGLMELNDRRCKWPVGGERAATLFCGGAIDFGAVYCACHRARAVQRTGT